MQCNQSNFNSIVLLRSDFASIFDNTAIFDRQLSTDAVVQLVVGIDFISVCTYG